MTGRFYWKPAERDLGRLPNPSSSREACAVIDDLQFDPVPPGAPKTRQHMSHNPPALLFVQNFVTQFKR